ncbi:hypothetical protein PO909_000423 [Leuciscus waleckii]
MECRVFDYGALDQVRDWPAEILRTEFSTAGTEKTTSQKVRKRGKKGGLRQRLRKQGLNRIPLPSIILANCQSLRNKLDELQANVRFLSDYRNACVISLTETWLKEHDLDSDLEIEGFGVPVRLDRDAIVTDIELLSISLRPFYLPREFPQIFISVVYIHPKNKADVRSCFGQVKVGKSPGPDHIGGRLLRNCAEQLSEIYSFIFNESLQLSKVPRLWKDAIVMPIAKKNYSTSLKDYRPVALTSLVMKSFEKIVRKEILASTQSALDPMQFAYRSGRGVDDATCTLLNMILRHLEGKKTHVRLLFIDFSSAFNCVQPFILAKKLIDNFHLDLNIVCWLVDFLTNRSQRVRVNGVLSNVLLSSTGTPQGCVLSPLLFSLYTDDCRSIFNGRHIVKFADDSVIVSLLNEFESDSGPVTDHFIQWCDASFLNINASKTKEMFIDFRKKNSVPVLPSAIKGHQVEVVTQYKYLGTVFDDKLQFEANTDIIRGKALQRMYFLRKLRTFNMDVSFMKMFYTCFIEAVLSFSIICWYGNLNVKNRRKLTSIVTMCSKIVGIELRTITQIYEHRTTRKGQLVLSDVTHPLCIELQLLPSGRRFKLPLCKSNRYRNSFIPAAIRFLNDLL